jgi:aubergine-like protein
VREVEESKFLVSSKNKKGVAEFGQTGSQVSLLSNYVGVSLPQSVKIFMSSLVFEPKLPNPKLEMKLLGEHATRLKEIGGAYVFMGRTGVIYSRKPLAEKEPLVLESRTSFGETYKIVIKSVREISSDSLTQDCLQFFNVLIKKSFSMMDLQQIGRNLFFMDKAVKFNEEIDVVPGLLSAIYLTQTGVLMNIDTLKKVVSRISILSVYQKIESECRGNKEEVKFRFKKEVQSTIALCNYGGRANKRTFRVTGVDFDKNPSSTFDRDGKQVSFLEYYLQQYNVRIKDLTQPLLESKPRDKNRPMEYYIPELCLLTGLTNRLKTDSRLARDLKKEFIVDSSNKMHDINDIIQLSSASDKFQSSLEEFGVKVDNRLVEVRGRVLAPQDVIYGSGVELSTSRGMMWNFKDGRTLFKPPRFEDFLVIYPPDKGRDDEVFVDQVMKCFKNLGVSISNQQMITATARGYDKKDYIEAIRKSVSKNTSFVLILKESAEGKDLYDELKKYLTHQLPIPSQVVRKATYEGDKGLYSKAEKVAIQIGTKVSCIPWTLKDMAMPDNCMVCGMDVFKEPESTSGKDKENVFGFTASLDPKVTKFYSRSIEHKAGNNLADELKGVFADAMKAYQSENARFPDHVLFYRDGVAESKMQRTMPEVEAVKEVMKKMTNGSAKLCFLNVLKRIHTRMFMRDGYGNPKPGTILDNHLTNGFEWFMVAQSVNQGTAVPTRYQCLLNEQNMSMEFLEKFSYQLSHVYYNWNSTIRVPSPCMYAKKLAFLCGSSISSDSKELATHLYYL